MPTRSLAPVAALLVAALLAVPGPAAGEDPPVVVKPAVLQGRVLQPVRGGAAPAQADAALSDEEALKKAGLAAGDGAKLVEYLRLRTLSDAEQGKIGDIIARFGADGFDDREQATAAIEAFGPAAIGPLRKAAEGSDPEVVYRARLALRRLETVPHSAVAAAAVRAVVKLKPEGAAAALIGFLPVADTEVVADVIRQALVDLAVRDGKADPAVVAALTDKLPVRRAAAYVALVEGGPPGQGVRAKDVYPRLKEAVLKDEDVESKFVGLWSLALTTRDKEFLPELITLVPKLPRGRLWQLEELLLLMAQAHPKGGRFLKSQESLEKARDVWLAWWKEKGGSIDLVKFDYKPRVRGITDLVEIDGRGYGPGRVTSLGPDLKPKWQLADLQYPTDMRVAANGNVWVVESNNNMIREWTTAGKVVTTRSIGQQPLNIDLLPDGGMVVVCRNQVVQLDKDGNQKLAFQRPNYDIMGGCRLTNGQTLFVTNLYQGENAFRLDEKLESANKDNDAKKRLQFGRIQQLQAMHALPDDKLLVCEFDKVAEYDLKTGKQTWKYDTPQNSAQSCQRLPNGNNLIALFNQNRVVEVDPSGEVVWEYTGKENMRVSRAYRR